MSADALGCRGIDFIPKRLGQDIGKADIHPANSSNFCPLWPCKSLITSPLSSPDYLKRKPVKALCSSRTRFENS